MKRPPLYTVVPYPTDQVEGGCGFWRRIPDPYDIGYTATHKDPRWPEIEFVGFSTPLGRATPLLKNDLLFAKIMESGEWPAELFKRADEKYRQRILKAWFTRMAETLID